MADLTDRERHALAALRLAHTALNQAEWGGGETDEGMCPACGAYQWAHGAHHQGCRLAAALAAIRALLPEVDAQEEPQ